MSEETQKEILPNKEGVKTPEGKAISRYNAQKHAILRETLTDYEKTDIETLYNDLVDDIKPNGRLQETLVEVIVSNIVRIQRIAKAESEVVKFLIGSMKWGALDSKYSPELPTDTAGKLELYSRYQTATENRIYRALMMLRQLKTNIIQ